MQSANDNDEELQRLITAILEATRTGFCPQWLIDDLEQLKKDAGTPEDLAKTLQSTIDAQKRTLELKEEFYIKQGKILYNSYLSLAVCILKASSPLANVKEELSKALEFMDKMKPHLDDIAKELGLPEA